jgi:hypothetical protein
MSGQLKYWRADNMWAAAGRPDGDLGEESISLQPGQTRVFVTDWKYEKRRNDGTNYYGSHGRKLSNPGTVPIDVVLVGNLDKTSFSNFFIQSGLLGGVIQTVKGGRLRLKPGQSLSIKNDIAEVLVPKL